MSDHVYTAMTHDEGGSPLVAVHLRDPRISVTIEPDDAAKLWHSLGDTLQMEHSGGLAHELEAERARRKFYENAATHLGDVLDSVRGAWVRTVSDLNDARGELAEEHELRTAAEDQAARDRTEAAQLAERVGELAAETEQQRDLLNEWANRAQHVKQLERQLDHERNRANELREELATVARTLQETREQLDTANAVADRLRGQRDSIERELFLVRDVLHGATFVYTTTDVAP